MPRPSLWDRLLLCPAKWHARDVYRRFAAAARRATAVQEQVLRARIRSNADSDFGRRHGFDRIGSAADFVRRVPIRDYEGHRPWIEKVKAGDIRALFGPGERVLMFALTSGTTQEPKYIPVTSRFLADYRRGWNAFGIKALLDHPAAFLRGIVQVTSRMDESRTAAGIPCGAITGLMAATQKRLVRKYYVTPQCLSRIEDPASKYYTIMRLALPADVAFLITASPATQLKLARAGAEHTAGIIRDVRDGTLRADLAVPAAVREALRPRLRPDPASAARLERIAAAHGRLLPRHCWDLAFLANWTGGTMGLYLADFPEYFGDVPVRDIGLLASEGRVSVPIEDGTPAGVLDVGSHFFEFVPADRIDEAAPPALRSHQVDVGGEYFVLLTTSSGLYRYDLRDLVRVVGFFGEAPVIEFLHKGAHVCSLAGEKLTEHQVVLAMARAARRTGSPVHSFVLAPLWGDPPRYRLHVETPEGSPPDHAALLAAALDAELAAANIEYASRRRDGRLQAVCVNVLPAGFLAGDDLEQAARHRRGNEQYKHRYLLCRPGEDARFPLQAPAESPARR